MLDFAVFDSILDIVFVVDADGRIVYCNDTAALFCSTSVKRVSGKVLLCDLMTFGEAGLLPFTETSPGRFDPTPFVETSFTVPKIGKAGKVQIGVRPLGDGAHWGFFIKDVSLEETLAAKYRGELAKTEEYARNLEKLVAARTSELNALNLTLNAILNSLGQGFFTFNAAGDCGAVFTRACEDVLEGSPKGRKAWDVLGSGLKADEFRKWSESIFKEYLPFEDLKPLGPDLFPHRQGKHIALDYFPIRRESHAIEEVVVVATDQTAEFAAQSALEVERQYAEMVVKFTKNKEQFLSFLASTRETLARLNDGGAKPMGLLESREILRVLHTVEGEAGAFSLRDLRAHARAAQHALGEAKDQGPGAEALANYAQALAAMDGGFKQFLITNQDLFQLPAEGVQKTLEVPLEVVTGFLNRLTRSPGSEALAEDFRRQFLRVRVSERLKYFDGLAQSVAEKLGKRLKPLKINGGDTRLFPEPYQAMFSAMVHAFRNAVDHGLETPDEREWAGKAPEGQIEVDVTEAGDKLTLVIRDDGRGVDPEIIRKKLPEKFPDRDFSEASDEEIVQAICLPGFSSRESVGEFSGRGVGLDALNEEVLKIGGRLYVRSELGRGTSIEINIPVLGPDTSLSLRSA